jgi:DNA invertase Pin-like site-specific DNA recombinase
MFNTLSAFAEFEAALIRSRTREGMAVARAKGRIRGRQPKLTGPQQRHLIQLHAAGEYTQSELAELFGISRAAVYRALQRSPRSA